MDRNSIEWGCIICLPVALRKESVDRNILSDCAINARFVALRKESVDRNSDAAVITAQINQSLSARRAWIEISSMVILSMFLIVALRKESVDRNQEPLTKAVDKVTSRSARRPWIEIPFIFCFYIVYRGRSPQGERG